MAEAKPNAIEEIMAGPVSELLATVINGPLAKQTATEVVRQQAAALDAAGLAVVPKEATEAMSHYGQDYVGAITAETVWADMVANFNSTTWKPKT